MVAKTEYTLVKISSGTSNKLLTARQTKSRKVKYTVIIGQLLKVNELNWS